jgi:hypothetical protein
MSLEVLDVELVKRLAAEKGLKLVWISQKIGMSRHSGYVMFRDGLMPKDPDEKDRVLSELGELLGVSASKLRVRLKRA